MSAIDTIRSGIISGDWADVVEGYRVLSGDSLPVPLAAPSGAAEGALRAILDLANEGLGLAHGEVGVCAPRPAEPPPKKKGKGKKTPAGTVPKPALPPAAPVRAKPSAGVAKPADDFSIEHGSASTEKGTACKSLPIELGPGTNKFVDDGRLAVKEAEQSRELSRQFRGKEPRDEFKPVGVVCSRCGRKEEVHPSLAPRKIDSEDEAGSYVCSRCVRVSQ